MFFKRHSSKNSKVTTSRQTTRSGGYGDRRLTLEHLENRALLSGCPVASQLATGNSVPGLYAGQRTSTVATQYVIIAPPAVQSGVQTTIELVALNASGRPVPSYNGTATFDEQLIDATL